MSVKLGRREDGRTTLPTSHSGLTTNVSSFLFPLPNVLTSPQLHFGVFGSIFAIFEKKIPKNPTALGYGGSIFGIFFSKTQNENFFLQKLFLWKLFRWFLLCLFRDAVQSFGEICYLEFVEDSITPLPLFLSWIQISPYHKISMQNVYHKDKLNVALFFQWLAYCTYQKSFCL